MFTSADLEKEKNNIKAWLSEDNHFADVYSLHTNDEGWASVYFIELKQRFPKSNIEKFVTLWKWHQKVMAKEGDYHIENDRLDSIELISQFQFVEDNFNPKKYSIEHKNRIEEIFIQTKPLIINKSSCFEHTLIRYPGLYQNGRLIEGSKIDQIQSKLAKCDTGMVVVDEWNELTAFFPASSNMFMFHWSTGA